MQTKQTHARKEMTWTAAITALLTLMILAATVQADRFVVTTLSAANDELGNISDDGNYSFDGSGTSLCVGNLGGDWWPADGKGLIRYQIPTLVPDEELVSATLRLRVRDFPGGSHPPWIQVYYAGNDTWDSGITYAETTYGGGTFDFAVGDTSIQYFRAIDGTNILPPKYPSDRGELYKNEDGLSNGGKDIWYEYNVLDFLGYSGEGPGETITFFVDHRVSGARIVRFYGSGDGGVGRPQLVITTFIPEPTAFALLGLGALPLMMRRRRR